jgi:hypothetical protein
MWVLTGLLIGFPLGFALHNSDFCMQLGSLNWSSAMLVGLPAGSWASARLRGRVNWRAPAPAESSPGDSQEAFSWAWAERWQAAAPWPWWEVSRSA